MCFLCAAPCLRVSIAFQPPQGRSNDPRSPKSSRPLSKVTTATLTTLLLKKGLRNVWMRGTRPIRTGPAAARRARVHAALRARARGPRHAGVVVEADLHPRRDRGDARGLHRRGRCARRDRRGHLRRHPLRAHGEEGVAGLVTDGVVRDMQGVLGTGLAGVVPGRRGAAFRGGPHLRELAGAHRLRRRGGVSRRRGGGGRGRRGAHSRGARGRHRRHRARAGAHRGVDHGRGREGGCPSRPLSDERRNQGALRGERRNARASAGSSGGPASGAPAGH